MDVFVDTFINPALIVVYVLVGPIAFIRMVQACLLFMTSRGDREQVLRAKSIFTGAVVGYLFVIFAVWIVVNLGRLTGIPEFQ